MTEQLVAYCYKSNLSNELLKYFVVGVSLKEHNFQATFSQLSHCLWETSKPPFSCMKKKMTVGGWEFFVWFFAFKGVGLELFTPWLAGM